MKTTIITLLSLFLLNGCDKDDKPADYNPQLPAITQTGANTFGVVLNNIIYVPRSSSNDIYNILYPKYNGVKFFIDDKSLSFLVKSVRITLTV